MARTSSVSKAISVSSSDHDHQNRKRVGKACDRCRLKKSKCNGTSPCLRCQQDNAICVFGERKRAHDKQYPKGYVEMLEGQQQQLVTGLQELYKMAANGGWEGAPLELTTNGHPLTHDILESLGLLKHGDQEGFDEDFEAMQQKLIHDGADVMQHHSSDDESDHSPPSFESMSPRVSHRIGFASAEMDSPPTPKTPELFLQQPSTIGSGLGGMSNAAGVGSVLPDNAAGLATLQEMRLQRQNQGWQQQMPMFADDMDFLYKSSMGYQPDMAQLGLFDDVSMGMQNSLISTLPDMDMDFYLQQ